MEITQQDREYVVSILTFFWPKDKITDRDVTEGLVVFAERFLSESKVCSDSMDLVPRPTGMKPNPKWALKQIRKIARRFIDDNPDIYIACRNEVSIRWRSVYIDALLMGGY